MRREGLVSDAGLPTSLRLAKDIEQLPETVRALRSESAVRAAVGRLNERIRDWLRAPTEPYRPVAPVDVEQVLRRWRDHA